MVDISVVLSDALGVDCSALSSGDLGARLRRGLSMLAYSSFDFQPLEILGEKVLVARPRERLSPSRLTRLLDEVGRAVDETVVCSLSSVTPYLRGVLLGEGRGFVTDDGQAYVPGLMRLVPRRRLPRASISEPWGPAERQAFLYLLANIGGIVTSAGLREATGMSATSANRALAAVAAVAPLERGVGGATRRAHIWRVEDAEAFVECGTLAFGEPVRRRVFVESSEAGELPLAGLSALSERSMLAAPAVEQRACGVRDVRGLRPIDPHEASGAASEVLVLSYDPMPFAKDGMVDLYTTIRTVDRSDERVDSAIEGATEDCPWLRLA